MRELRPFVVSLAMFVGILILLSSIPSVMKEINSSFDTLITSSASPSPSSSEKMVSPTTFGLPPNPTVHTTVPPAAAPVETPKPVVEHAPDPIKWGTIGTALIIIAAVLVGFALLVAIVYFLTTKVHARRKAAKAETDTRAVVDKKWAQGVSIRERLLVVHNDLNAIIENGE